MPSIRPNSTTSSWGRGPQLEEQLVRLALSRTLFKKTNSCKMAPPVINQWASKGCSTWPQETFRDKAMEQQTQEDKAWTWRQIYNSSGKAWAIAGSKGSTIKLWTLSTVQKEAPSEVDRAGSPELVAHLQGPAPGKMGIKCLIKWSQAPESKVECRIINNLYKAIVTTITRATSPYTPWRIAPCTRTISTTAGPNPISEVEEASVWGSQLEVMALAWAIQVREAWERLAQTVWMDSWTTRWRMGWTISN